MNCQARSGGIPYRAASTPVTTPYCCDGCQRLAQLGNLFLQLGDAFLPSEQRLKPSTIFMSST